MQQNGDDSMLSCREKRFRIHKGWRAAHVVIQIRDTATVVARRAAPLLLMNPRGFAEAGSIHDDDMRCTPNGQREQEMYYACAEPQLNFVFNLSYGPSPLPEQSVRSNTQYFTMICTLLGTLEHHSANRRVSTQCEN